MSAWGRCPCTAPCPTGGARSGPYRGRQRGNCIRAAATGICPHPNCRPDILLQSIGPPFCLGDLLEMLLEGRLVAVEEGKVDQRFDALLSPE